MSSNRPLIGWREWVLLGSLDPSRTPIKAKIDTGARTSCLHAFNLRVTTDNDVGLAAFELHPHQRRDRPALAVTAPIKEFREVRSSTGQLERRPVIVTPLSVGTHRFSIELTLTDRDEMGFRLLLGRTAIRHRFWVNPARSFIQTPPEPPPGCTHPGALS